MKNNIENNPNKDDNDNKFKNSENNDRYDT